MNALDPYKQIPLHLAARTGHVDCIQQMLQVLLPPTLVVLKFSLSFKLCRTVRFLVDLLQEGAEVNATDTEGNTAFDWADDFGHGDCAVQLWQKGAHIKTQTGKGYYFFCDFDSSLPLFLSL